MKFCAKRVVASNQPVENFSRPAVWIFLLLFVENIPHLFLKNRAPVFRPGSDRVFSPDQAEQNGNDCNDQQDVN